MSALSRYRAHDGRLNGLQNNLLFGPSAHLFSRTRRAAHRHVLHQDDTDSVRVPCCVCESDILLCEICHVIASLATGRVTQAEEWWEQFALRASSADELLQNLRRLLDFKWAVIFVMGLIPSHNLNFPNPNEPPPLSVRCSGYIEAGRLWAGSTVPESNRNHVCERFCGRHLHGRDR